MENSILNSFIKEKGKALLLALLKETQPKDFLTTKEMCNYLHISKSTLERWRKKGVIKSYGVEGRVYFSRDEVKSLILSSQLN